MDDSEQIKRGRRGRNVFFGVIGCFIASVGISSTQATTRTILAVAQLVTITCDTCSSYATLQAAAQQYFNNHNGYPAPGFPVIPTQLGNITYFIRSGTKAMVTSVQHPMSANFTLGVTTAPISVTTDQGAYNFDGVAFARAQGLPTIKLPPSVPSNTDPPELIGAAIGTILTEVGPPAIDYPSSLRNLKPVVYYNVVDLQTGLTYKVFVGDPITIQYSDGSTEKWKYFGPEAGSVKWQRVPNTYRPAPQANTSTIGGGFGFEYNGTLAIGAAPFVYPTPPLPNGKITVGDPIASVTTSFDSTGWFGDFSN